MSQLELLQGIYDILASWQGLFNLVTGCIQLLIVCAICYVLYKLFKLFF